MDVNQAAELVKRFKNGDVGAFDELYKNSRQWVYLTCYGHLKNHEDAEDTTQEVFITVYNKLNTLNDDATYFKWLKTIAVNTCLNKLRYLKDNISFDDAIGNEEILEGDDNLETIPDAYIMLEEKRKIINTILESNLSEVQYQTVFMYYYDGMSTTQIAKTMGCSEGTVKTRLMSSRVKIKEGISKYESETGDKLNAVGALPFLAKFFNTSLSTIRVPFVPFAGFAGNAAKGAVAKTVAKNAAKKAAGSAAKATVSKGIATKVIISVLGLSILSGGALATLKLIDINKKDNHKKDETETVSTEINTNNELVISFDEPDQPVETTVETTIDIVPEPLGMEITDYVTMVPVELSNQTALVPQITLTNKELEEEINNEILDYATLNNEHIYCTNIYVTASSDHTISILLESTHDFNWTDYSTINVDVSTDTLMTNSEVITLLGYSEEDFYSLALNYVKGYYTAYSHSEPYVGDMFVDGELNMNSAFVKEIYRFSFSKEEFENSLSRETLINAPLYLDSDGNFFFKDTVSFYGGSGYYDRIIGKDEKIYGSLSSLTADIICHSDIYCHIHKTNSNQSVYLVNHNDSSAELYNNQISLDTPELTIDPSVRVALSKSGYFTYVSEQTDSHISLKILVIDKFPYTSIPTPAYTWDDANGNGLIDESDTFTKDGASIDYSEWSSTFGDTI